MKAIYKFGKLLLYSSLCVGPIASLNKNYRPFYDQNFELINLPLARDVGLLHDALFTCFGCLCTLE